MTYFFENASQLVNIFTAPRPVPAAGRKFAVEGLKPIEAFCSDIYSNLVSWATDGKETVFYRTMKHWYMFAMKDGLVEMTRFDNGQLGPRIDDWANTSSLSDMRKLRCANKDKKIELFNVRR